jgi:hypothetical protein
MEGPILERDWKYLRTIQAEMLHELCSGILKKAVKISDDEGRTPHEKYALLFRHIKESDDVIADCFDNWRRSRIRVIVLNLRRHKLLTDDRLKGLSEKAQNWLHVVEEAL